MISQYWDETIALALHHHKTICHHSAAQQDQRLDTHVNPSVCFEYIQLLFLKKVQSSSQKY